MSLFTGKECVYCHQPFKEGDDVVVCPTCGAPHHRECYSKEHKCALESKHGTNEEWGKQNELNYDIKAPINEQENINFSENDTPDMEQFALYGLMNENEKIDDISADELASFVGKGSYYYLTKFKKMNETGKNTWNFWAFFFNYLYFFYRKLYKQGIVLLIVAIISTVPSFMVINQFTQHIAAVAESEIITVNSAQRILLEMMSAETNPDFASFNFWFTMSNIMSFVNFIVALLAGFGANKIYMKHCIEKIKYTRAAVMDYKENPNYKYSLRILGSVSFQKAMFALLGYGIFRLVASFMIVMAGMPGL